MLKGPCELNLCVNDSIDGKGPKSDRKNRCTRSKEPSYPRGTKKKKSRRKKGVGCEYIEDLLSRI